MIADRHGVEADGVDEIGLGRALEGGVEQRALEIVAAVQHQHVLAAERGAALVDGGLQAGGAAEAFVLALFLGRAARIVFVDRFDAGVEIVDVQDVEFVIRKGDARG